jgi:hypothetical protein
MIKYSHYKAFPPTHFYFLLFLSARLVDTCFKTYYAKLSQNGVLRFDLWTIEPNSDVKYDLTN